MGIESKELQEAALQYARKLGRIDPGKIASLPQKESAKKMHWLRIWTVNLMRLHGEEWNGTKAAQYLLEARGVFETYYQYPEIVAAASEMKEDPAGHEYQMKAEMLRDRGKWCLYWAELTGNSASITQAVEYFDQAVLAATERSLGWAVATMEKEIAVKQLGKKIDWGVFSRAYQTVVEISPQTDGWNSMALVSWWYAKEALLTGRRKDLELGLNSLKKATQKLEVNWIVQYPLKDIMGSFWGISRRITYSHGLR